MSVVEALDRELAEIRKRAPDVADGALAASARVLALELDNAGNSATSKSMCQKALREAMDRLHEIAPPREERTKLDELKSRREARRGRAAS